MDEQNRKDILKMCTSDLQKQKVYLLLEETNHSTLKNVPDPYYGTLNDFEKRKPFQMVGYSGKENLYVNVNLGVGYRQMMQDKAWWYVEPTIQLPTQSHGGARKTTMGVNLGIRKWF